MSKEPSTVKRNPEGTRRRILEAAIEEFRRGGFAGARVEYIAKRAETNERMLYYYFQSKRNLFIASLEAIYDQFIAAQNDLRLENLAPEKALIRYVNFIWDYYFKHPELIRLVNNENLHQAEHLRESGIPRAFSPVVDVLVGILKGGAEAGVFRRDIDPLRLYLTISALGFYALSNQHTLEATFGRDFAAAEEHAALMAQHTDMLLTYLRDRPLEAPRSPDAAAAC